MVAPLGIWIRVSVGLRRLLPGCSLSLTAETGAESVKRVGVPGAKTPIGTGYHPGRAFFQSLWDGSSLFRQLALANMNEVNGGSHGHHVSGPASTMQSE